MKNQTIRLSLLLILGSLSVVGCSCSSQPGSSASTDSSDLSSDSTSVSESVSASDSSLVSTAEKTQTYHFFIDYSHSDIDFYTLKWWALTPLGESPAECRLGSDDATDPLFPVFLGWSLYPSAIDDSNLWDFATDYKTALKVSLYGIWVAND